MKNRYKKVLDNFKKNNLYSIEDSIKIIKLISCKKLIENIEININFNIKNSKHFINLCGFFNFYESNFKNKRVAILCSDKNINFIKNNSNPDFVGNIDIINKINLNKKNIDILLAYKNDLNEIKKFFNKLKNKNLIPKIENETIISNLDIINKIKKGICVFYKYKNGILNIIVGKINTKEEIIVNNIKSFLDFIKNKKIKNFKNEFIKNIYLTSTMGIGIKIYF